jgi:acetyltransferase-like isoleucine patch superfamily enzyme
MAAREVYRRVAVSVRTINPPRQLFRARRALLLVRLRLAAWWHHAEVVLDLAPDLRLGRRIGVMVTPGTRNELAVGRGCSIGDGAVFVLAGGRIRIGENSSVRNGVVLNVAGHLELEGENIVSWGSVIHCAERIRVGRRTGFAEYTTVADSNHVFRGDDTWFVDHVESAPIDIADNVWVGAKATIVSGVSIGRYSVVAAHAVVTRDVAAGHQASGIPARDIRSLDLPWMSDQAP